MSQSEIVPDLVHLRTGTHTPIVVEHTDVAIDDCIGRPIGISCFEKKI